MFRTFCLALVVVEVSCVHLSDDSRAPPKSWPAFRTHKHVKLEDIEELPDADHYGVLGHPFADMIESWVEEEAAWWKQDKAARASGRDPGLWAKTIKDPNIQSLAQMGMSTYNTRNGSCPDCWRHPTVISRSARILLSFNLSGRDPNVSSMLNDHLEHIISHAQNLTLFNSSMVPHHNSSASVPEKAEAEEPCDNIKCGAKIFAIVADLVGFLFPIREYLNSRVMTELAEGSEVVSLAERLELPAEGLVPEVRELWGEIRGNKDGIMAGIRHAAGEVPEGETAARGMFHTAKPFFEFVIDIGDRLDTIVDVMYNHLYHEVMKQSWWVKLELVAQLVAAVAMMVMWFCTAGTALIWQILDWASSGILLFMDSWDMVDECFECSRT